MCMERMQLRAPTRRITAQTVVVYDVKAVFIVLISVRVFRLKLHPHWYVRPSHLCWSLTKINRYCSDVSLLIFIRFFLLLVVSKYCILSNYQKKKFPFR